MLLGNRLWMWAFSVEWVHLDWISEYKLVLKTIQNMALPPSNSPLGQGGQGPLDLRSCLSLVDTGMNGLGVGWGWSLTNVNLVNSFSSSLGETFPRLF